jgi:hypothetical protein
MWCLSGAILRERTRAGLVHARQNGKRLGRPATAAIHATEIGDCTAPASANPRSLVGYGSAGHLSAGSRAHVHETSALLKSNPGGLAGVTHAALM